jgi:hypothetical protein
MATREDIFTYRITKDDKVLISWQGRLVMTLASSRADRFRERVEGLDSQGVQLLLARATGNFKRGNERTT